MRLYRELLLQRLNIRSGPWQIHRLVLHHHHSTTLELKAHEHSYGQILCYISGSGKIRGGENDYSVNAGHVVLIPKGFDHAFVREAKRNPLCLVVCFDHRPARKQSFRVAHADAATMGRVRQCLAEIGQLQKNGQERSNLGTASRILALMELLLQTVGESPRPQPVATSLAVRKSQAVLRESPDAPIREIIRKVGYQADHLNRLLRREVGLSLGQMRAEKRLDLAKRRLRDCPLIADAATASGFDDPNYFSRWFRKQTGMTPSHFAAMEKHGK